MSKGIKKIRFKIEYFLLKNFYDVLAILPKSIIKFFCNILGILAFDFFKIRRKVTLKNLKIAFPEKKLSELKKIARRTYQNFGYIFVDMALLGRLNRKTLLKNTVIEGKDILKEAGKIGRGAILVSGHIGNWERVGYIFPSLGYRTSFIARNQNNPYISNMQNSIRKKFGIGIILRSSTLKKVLKELEDGKFIAMLSDQDAGDRGMKLDFFGVKASTPIGAAKLSIKKRIPLIFTYGVYRENVFFCKIEEIRYSYKESPEELMQKFVKKLEETIKKYPAQYFWMHRRWKASINYK